MSAILKGAYRHPLLLEKDIITITERHEKMSFKKGDYLLRENEVAHEYFVLEEGLMRSYVNDYNGNEITTGFFAPQDVVIEVSSLFQRIPSIENIQAVTHCSCWRIGFEKFQQLFHQIEGFREWGRSWFTQQLFQCRQRAVEMVTLPAKERYLKLMEEKPAIIQNAPLKQIATYLGITDTSLSRIRKELV